MFLPVGKVSCIASVFCAPQQAAANPSLHASNCWGHFRLTTTLYLHAIFHASSIFSPHKSFTKSLILQSPPFMQPASAGKMHWSIILTPKFSSCFLILKFISFFLLPNNTFGWFGFTVNPKSHDLILCSNYIYYTYTTKGAYNNYYQRNVFALFTLGPYYIR